jgi:NAD(P)H-dependent FMN reductase
MSAPKILAFAGSTRAASYNKLLAKVAGDAARQAGAEVTFIDLRDYPLPLFDEEVGGRWSVVGGRWSAVGGRWSVVGDR